MIKNPLQLNMKTLTAFSLPVLLAVSACDSGSIGDIQSDLASEGGIDINVSTNEDGNVVIGTIDNENASGAEGGVFVMTNILDENTVVAYSRAADGTLTLAGEYGTGGQGSDQFDGPEGLDPLISAYALINTPDNESW